MKNFILEAIRGVMKLKKYAKTPAAKELVQRILDAILDFGEERVKEGTLQASTLAWLRAVLEVPEFDDDD